MQDSLPKARAKARAKARGGPQDEFPVTEGQAPDVLPESLAKVLLDRRQVLELMGASLGLAGLSGCFGEPEEIMVPYVEKPPEVTPGVSRFYATSMVLDGFARGLLAESREGRPIKLEGNPDHPATLGATGVFEQASVLELYEPSRARSILHNRVPSTWNAFLEHVAIGQNTDEQAAGRQQTGDGLWFLLYPQSSPTLAALMARVRARYPTARFVFHSPVDRRDVYTGARWVFGRPLEAQYDFTRARVVASLDADFLDSMPMSVRWSREFANVRRPASPTDDMNRLYLAESMPTPTGTIADHRLRARASELPMIALQLFAAVVDVMGDRAQVPADIRSMLARVRAGAAGTDTPRGRWITALARDLAANAGSCIVLAGQSQPADVHALTHLINATLGNLGTTVTMTAPALLEPEGATMTDLVTAMTAGTVDTLVIIEANPVYTAPGDVPFAELLAQVPTSVHCSLYFNETSALCKWFLPAAHYLESWGDARAYDGTISFIQPLVQQLYNGRTPTEILAAFAGDRNPSAHALVRDYWRDNLPAVPSFEWSWQNALKRGLLPNTAYLPDVVTFRWDNTAEVIATAARHTPLSGLELNLTVSPTVYDGRFSNNAWLQELPHPMTKLTWDNAAILAPQTAVRLGIDMGDELVLEVGGRSVRTSALLLPGHAEDVVTLDFGYGRAGEEAVARNVGVNAYVLRSSTTGNVIANLQLRKTGGRYYHALTQTHWHLHGRDMVTQASLAEYRSDPDFAQIGMKHLPSLLPDPVPKQWRHEDQWAMSIDTSICTGCSSCVVACQAENNIPVIGREGVRMSREMHWLRIDRYFVGSPEEPDVINQPMLCQHCEHAPCEYVCPVNATVHSPDGLNEMVYNRCVGTRFCSNNCPYKVRRFNWFDYTDSTSRMLQRNPNVTVRERGVMEKCTFCVQRIRSAEIQARTENRTIAPGEVVTACQQACPTGAIQFGSLRHQELNVVEWRNEPRAYAVLHDQGTRPRVKYLAMIRNPNPELE